MSALVAAVFALPPVLQSILRSDASYMLSRFSLVKKSLQLLGSHAACGHTHQSASYALFAFALLLNLRPPMVPARNSLVMLPDKKSKKMVNKNYHTAHIQKLSLFFDFLDYSLTGKKHHSY